MPAGCPERISREFIDWIWNYPRRQRSRVLDRLRAVAGDKRVFILESRGDVDRFVANLTGGTETTSLPYGTRS
jgi:hypothetical protein